MYSAARFIPSIFAKRRPIHLTYFVTRKCNARCPYCFYPPRAPEAAEGEGELSLAEIRQASGSLGRLLWLAFSGGEIFLRRDLAEISRIFYDQNKPSVMLYPTNGLLPERIHDSMERIIRHCKNSVVCAKVSVDGLGEDHDRLRQTPGGFAKAMETCRLLSLLSERYANFELGINTVFSAGNQDAMDGLIDFVRGLAGVRTHTISLVRGDLAEARHKDVDLEKYRRATARLARELRQGTAETYRFRGARLKAAQDVLQRRLIHRTLLTRTRQIPCYAGRLNLVLNETGEVYSCENCDTPFGNIRDHGLDLMRLLRSPSAVAASERLAEQRCHCTHECNFIMNILFNPGTYPALAREYFRLYGVPRLWPATDRLPS